jgi:hypothetical protein
MAARERRELTVTILVASSHAFRHGGANFSKSIIRDGSVLKYVIAIFFGHWLLSSYSSRRIDPVAVDCDICGKSRDCLGAPAPLRTESVFLIRGQGSFTAWNKSFLLGYA